MIFLDTSAIVQAFERSSDPHQAKMTARSEQLLRGVATGRVEATTSEAAIVEAAHVMSGIRFFGRDVGEVVVTLRSFINSWGLRLESKAAYLRALDIWAERPRLGFVDALTIAYVEQGDVQLASFDRQLLATPGVTPYWRAPDAGR